MRNIISPISLFSLISLISFLSLNCGPSKEPLPTDMVNVPASAEEGLDKDELPDMKFEEELFDFGMITQGEKVSHDFKFRNTGESELIIANAYADCGCTVPEVPKGPIAPGQSGIIRVTFDSEGKQGLTTKSVSIMTNCVPNKRVVKIRGNIFVPAKK